MAEFDLGKKIGPLPLGLWLVVVAAGLFLGYRMNKGMSSGSGTETPGSQLTESGVGGGGGQFIYDPPQTGSPDTEPETNASWGRKAQNWLIAQNHDPTVADNAVRKYLSGLPLTTVERALISLVLVQFGTPPESLPVVDQPDTPQTPTGGKPNAVTGLYVAKAKLRNEVIWRHDNKDVVAFVVVVKNMKTGKETQKVVINAHPAGSSNTYSWSHHGDPSWTTKTRPRFMYYVRPYNGTQANPIWGPGAAVYASHNL